MSEPGIPRSGLAGCCLSAVVSHGVCLSLRPDSFRVLRWISYTRSSLENQPRERRSAREYCFVQMAPSSYNVSLIYGERIKRNHAKIPNKIFDYDVEAGRGPFI